MKKSPNNIRPSRALAALSTCLLMAAGMTAAQAATFTWDGGASPDVNWSNPVNWVGDTTAPADGDTLIFDGTVGLTNNNDITVNSHFKSITFAVGAGPFALQGNQIRIGNNTGGQVYGVTNNSPNIQTVEIETKNDRQVNYDTTGASMIFHRGPWDQRFSKSGPNDLICLQKINQLNGQITALTGGRLIMNGQTNGVAGLGLQIDAGGTAISVGPANQIGDTDTRADVTIGGNSVLAGILQIQNTNAAGAANFEQIPMLRSTNFLAFVENGAAVGPVQLRVGGGTGARVGAYDGVLRDGSGGGALSVALNNSSGAVFWRLGGTNSYTGETVITNGFASGFTRLIVNGLNSGGGAYTVSAGNANSRAVLAGAGTIAASSVNVNANGVIAPGGVLNGTTLYVRQGGGGSGSAGVNTGTFAESTATLTITNNVNLNDVSSALDIHLGGTNAGAADKLVVAGSGVFSNNNANLLLTIDLGFAPNPGDKFTLVEVPGTSAANNIGVFASLNGAAANLAQGVTNTLGGAIFKISYRAEGSTFDAGAGNGNDIMIEFLQDTSTKLTWRGDLNSDWDLGATANWRNTNNIATTFTNLDKVTFNDTGIATNVSLTTDLTPATILVDATQDYTFSGVGKLTGAMVITKTNTGKLTLLTPNDATGAAIIDRGTLEVGNGGSDGALLTAVTINSNGVFAFNRADDQFLGIVSGKGTLLHSGSGRLTVTNNLSTLTGLVSNMAGILQLGDATVGGNNGKVGGLVHVASGSTLYHNYNGGGGDVTAANSMNGSGSAIFEFSAGAPRSINLGTGVTNSSFTGTTTVKPFTRLNVSTATATPGGPIIVEGGASPAFGSYYTHPGATFTNFNSITIAGEGPSGVDTPRGKGALRLGNVWAGPVTLSANATIGGDGTGTIIGNITDGGNGFVLEYLGGTAQVGPATGTNSYGITQITEDYSGTFTNPIVTTVRVLNSNAFGLGPINMKGLARLEVNGKSVSIPNLIDVTTTTINGTSNSPVVANGNATNAATLSFGADGNNQLFTGRFLNGGAQPLSITKVGGGTFTVSGDSTNTGTVSVEGGTLALAAATGSYPDSSPVLGSGSFSNATLITVGSGATLDVTARTDGTLTLNSGQTLGGNGTVSGIVVASAGATVAPGGSIGTLTVSGNVTLNGKLLMEVNRTNTPLNCDRLVSSGGTITYGGTLSVTNIGPTLQVNDTFQLFTAAVSGFGAFALATTDASGYTYSWTNKTGIDGSVQVLTVTPPAPPVDPTPTNIVFSASGGNLTLSWPTNHIGWTLQAQTNLRSVGLNTNWVSFGGGYTNTNNVVIPFDATAPTVFFRLFYQVP